jgi:ATP-dependent RNA helicase CshB
MENIEELPFGSTSLKKEVLDILKEDGFVKMSPVQAKTIPLMIKNRNVLALAPTGTGKTLSYVLPIVNDLVNDGHVQAVIISPTVALLDQIKTVFEEFTSKLGFPSDAVKAVYSNNDFNRAKPVVLLITPSLYTASLSHYPINELKRVIIDEGDMVVFDGFKDALVSLKKPRDNMMISFFSASLNVQDIKRVKSLFNISNIVDVRDVITNNSVAHHLVNIRNQSKGNALSIFLKEKNSFKTIAFVSSSVLPLPKAFQLFHPMAGRRGFLVKRSSSEKESNLNLLSLMGAGPFIISLLAAYMTDYIKELF